MKRILSLGVVAAWACGGSSSSSTAWRSLNNICAQPRSGTSDKKGTLDDEKKFLKAWSDDLYLWYAEIPTVDASQYPTAIDYFNVLRTLAKTTTGNPKDKFHFTYDTTVWNQLSQSGVEAGYGFQVVLVSAAPPREAVIAYTEGSPATDPASHIQRGTHIISIDGVDLKTGSNVDALNAGLFPAAAGETHQFVFQDPDPSTQQWPVSLTSVNATHATVQHVGTISGTNVGYMQFNDHLATAEKALVDAITTLKGASVTDLVLDIRYNGGGYLAIASELAYMIAGPTPTSGKTFELTRFNDKHPTADPITGDALQPTPFYAQTVGLSVSSGQNLPHLDLPRVFILTGGSTCSASESVINSLRGVGVQVIQIGATTCGKPYGFYPQDNCGTTYFSIQFQGVNAKGFGDYPDGFTPSATDDGKANILGCPARDDFSRPLGDPGEARLATALYFRTNSACPATPLARSAALSATASEGVMPKAPWRENRLYLGR